MQAGKENFGEWPIHPTQLSKLPQDASIVLEIRRGRDRYQEEHHLTGPVADLIAEEAVVKEDPWLRVLNRQVTHPVSFMLPTPLLKGLAWFNNQEVRFF